MAEPTKIRPKTPPAPSRRGLPTVALPDDADDSPLGNLRRLTAHAHDFAAGLHGKAVSIAADGDLSDAGRRKATARHAAAELGKFVKRVTEERTSLGRERARLTAAADRRIRDAAGKLSDGELSEWRSALRALDPAARSAVLRAAAGGSGPGADAIMAAAATAASPILLGLAPDDPLFEVVVGQHRERLAEAELQALGALDQAESDATQAVDWLENYVCSELVPENELLDAQAVAQGGKPLAELSLAQKVRRAAAGIDAGLRGADALYRPLAGEGSDADATPSAADVAKFASQPLADRVAAGERGAAQRLSPSEIVAASVAVKE